MLKPGSTIGILGGGQLGRMLAMSAARLGYRCIGFAPEGDNVAAPVSADFFASKWDHTAALAAFAAQCDAVTWEFENVPLAAVDAVSGGGPAERLFPPRRALEVAQDRLNEKRFVEELGGRTAPYLAVDTRADIAKAAQRIGTPGILKTRREGYDGKGQRWVEHAADAAAAFAALGGVPVILEAPADFVRELSIIAARGRDGATAIYPLAENHHEGGILRRSLAPAQVSPQLAEQAERIAARVLQGLDYVGVVGIELFELKDGRLLVNEIAPRVHNTGHWTQDGCEADQFEQHIRAIAGWPLGPTAAIARVEMLNLLGDEADAWAKLAHEPETRLHLYGKREAKPGRKMGHVNKLKPL